MNRAPVFVVTIAVAMMALPESVAAQDHSGHEGMSGHNHAVTAVDCSTLASPPWVGLSVLDRERFVSAHDAVRELKTPAAAMAAGYRPVLGDIPGMGVHYVHRGYSRDGIHVDQPDHLMFAPVNGEDALVGAAYAFVDVPDTHEPLPYDSDLAHWHDHPEFAPDGETLHMLHIWFVPSSNGPFAGLNFWLPFHGAGITPPSACWMSDPDMSELIQRVAFALVPADNPIVARIDAARGLSGEDQLPRGRVRILQALGAAAEAGDMDAWMRAAERFESNLTDRERFRTRLLLQTLTNAQMSSAEREGVGVS
ncbi:MAG: hypothetical protein AAF389_15935 [Gemmatimonadota bacterium]